MFSFSLTPTVHHSHLLLHRSSGRSPPRILISPFTVRSSSSLQEVEKFSESSADRKDLSSELYASVPLPPIKTAKRVVLVRHGQSTWNAEGRIQGSSNFSVLTKKGEAQAETSRQMLFDDAFDVCFSRFPVFFNSIWIHYQAVATFGSDFIDIETYFVQHMFVSVASIYLILVHYLKIGIV